MSLIPLTAERLRNLRHRHSLTQQEFADLAGIAFTFYQLLESGRKKQIWLETVERLAAVYGLEVCEFLGAELPAETVIKAEILKRSLHYKRRRKGPYNKATDTQLHAKGNPVKTRARPSAWKRTR